MKCAMFAVKVCVIVFKLHILIAKSDLLDEK